MIKPIENTSKYFISTDGYCFKTILGKDVKIPFLFRGGRPMVKIEDKRYNFVDLLIQYFVNDFKKGSRIIYKVVDDKIPLKTIRFIKAPEKGNGLDVQLIFQYKCHTKAIGQNRRITGDYKLSETDILNALKRCDFKCFYCGDKILKDNWHLDHVVPICLGGQNVSQNIVSSCHYCNLMKGRFGMDKFLYKCRQIVENNVDFFK